MNEFERIDLFVRQFARVPKSPQGPGDDAAVLPPSPRSSCVTTDAVVEGVHFTRPAFSLEDVGHKALAVNLSDLAAMGAEPRWALCALGLPSRFSAADVVALGRGMAPLAAAHRVSLIGGNVTRSPVLSVTLTVGGALPLRRRALLRSGARPNERLYLSGPVGDASAGLSIVQRRSAPRTAAERSLVRAQRRPFPHLAWSAVAAPFVSAAIDVSDGLAQDLGHLCRSSGVGAALTQLPLSASLLEWASAEVAEHHALHGGEDYVVLAAVPEAVATRFERAMASRGLVSHHIGHTTARLSVTLRGHAIDTRHGHQHFR